MESLESFSEAYGVVSGTNGFCLIADDMKPIDAVHATLQYICSW